AKVRTDGPIASRIGGADLAGHVSRGRIAGDPSRVGLRFASAVDLVVALGVRLRYLARASDLDARQGLAAFGIRYRARNRFFRLCDEGDVRAMQKPAGVRLLSFWDVVARRLVVRLWIEAGAVDDTYLLVGDAGTAQMERDEPLHAGAAESK